MGEVVSWVYPPLGARPVVWLLVFGDSVRGKIPHLGIWIAFNILLHAKPCASRLIFSIPHASELLEVCLDILLGMFTTISWRQAVLATALLLGLDVVAMAHVSLLHLDQFFGEIVHSLVVVGRIRDFTRCESKPSDGLLNSDEVFSFLSVGVCVVESRIGRVSGNRQSVKSFASFLPKNLWSVSYMHHNELLNTHSSTTVELCKAKVDSDGLGVSKLNSLLATSKPFETQHQELHEGSR